MRITMSLKNNVFKKIYTKRKNRKFLLCITFLGSSKYSDWFKLHKIAEKFYLVNNQLGIINSLYNQLGIGKKFLLSITYSE